MGSLGLVTSLSSPFNLRGFIMSDPRNKAKEKRRKQQKQQEKKKFSYYLEMIEEEDKYGITSFFLDRRTNNVK